MKQGRTLIDIATELERQRHSAKDYIAPQGKIGLEVSHDTGAPMLVGVNGPMAITSHTHGQLASHLEIPKTYYDKMLQEDPELLTRNVNTWLHKAPEERRMVRTLDNRVRAFLSNKYRPLDNFDLAEAVLPTLQKAGVQVMSAELTETRMYIKGILPSLSDTLPEGMAYGGHNQIPGTIMGQSSHKGHLVAAIVISNSPVGAGALRVEPSVFTTWCTNLAIIAQAAMKKYHIGRSFEEQANFEAYQDETRKADDKALWLKVRDVVVAALNGDTFKIAVDQVRQAAGNHIKSEELAKVVEVTVKRLALPESTQGSILTHLAKGGDLSQWGLSSAITSAANALEDYEDATLLERAGGKIISLAPQEWKIISEAGAGV